ncbi:MAG: TonB-dependent receptor [Melioribacteraceae bacterium]
MKFLYLLFCTSLLLTSIYAQGKNDSLRTFNLGEVIVTSQRPVIIKSSSVFDVNLERIEATGGADISKAVGFEPGVYISSSSKNESKIYLRGFDQRDISVFIDGVPIYQPYDGLVDLSNLPVNVIGKITVSKGMPSLLYGANSMGGTINLISKTCDYPFTADLNLEHGFAQKASAGFNGTTGSVYYSLNGSFSKSNGFKLPGSFANTVNEKGGERDNSQFENRGAMLKLGVNNLFNFELAYTLMIIDNEKGIPADVYSSKPRYWRFGEWKKTVNNLMFGTEIAGDVTVRGNFFFEKFRNVLDSYDDATFTTQNRPYAFRSTYDDHTLGINLSSSFKTKQTGLTRLFVSYKKDVHKEEGNFNEGFKKYEADNLSMAAEQETEITGDLSVVAGAGLNYLKPVYSNGSEPRSSASVFNANLGINFKLREKIILRANLSGNSRFPTLREFYSETKGRYLSNPALIPEKSFNTEAGIICDYLNRDFIELTLFYSSVKGLIQEVPVSGGLKQFQNIGNVILAGVEFSADYKNEVFIVDLNYTYLYAKNRSANSSTEILEYRPEHSASIISVYNFNSGLNLGFEIFYLAKQYGINLDTNAIVPMPDYELVNLRVAQKIFDRYTLYLRVNNVFEKYYESEYGYPQPGRELLFGIKINW